MASGNKTVQLARHSPSLEFRGQLASLEGNGQRLDPMHFLGEDTIEHILSFLVSTKYSTKNIGIDAPIHTKEMPNRPQFLDGAALLTVSKAWRKFMQQRWLVDVNLQARACTP